jgi:hypothetical protein
MSSLSTSIVVLGNSSNLVSRICAYKNEQIKFHSENILSSSKYLLYLVSLSNDLENVSQKIIDLYSTCREKKQKLVICLIFDEEINRDKIFHFQKLLDGLGRQEPLHRLVIVKDLYQDSSSNPVTLLDQEIRHLLSSDSINISSKGNNYLYPLHLDDFIYAITKIFFLNSTAGKTYYLQGDPIKDLELAYLVKNIVVDDNPSYQINSKLENIPYDTESISLANSTQIQINWRPSIDFENSLRKIYHEKNDQEIVDETNTTPIKRPKDLKILNLFNRNFRLLKSKFIPLKKSSSNRKRKIGKLILIIAVCYLLEIGAFIGSTYMSFKYLSQSLTQIQVGNIQGSVASIEKSNTYNNIAINIYWPIRPLSSLYSKTFDEEIHNMFSFSQYLENSLSNLQQAYILTEKIYQSFNDTSGTSNIEDQTIALKTSLGQVYENLSQINIMINSSKLPTAVEDKLKNDNIFKQLPNIENQLSQSIKLLNLLPSIASNTDKKTTAIIVQDQDELRSLGGVIRYLILVTIDKSKVTDIKVLSQSDISGLSDGSVKAPDIIAGITGSASWKFRDMTYFSDFSQTSEYLSWYLQKIGNVKPNNFISINKSFFESLINDSKNIIVDGNTITTESLKSKIGEPDSETLKNVINYYLDLYKKNNLPLSNLSRVVTSELEKGNLFIWSDDQTIESSISTLPFSGVISQYRCHSSLANYSQCLNQTTYLTESNFSVANINLNLKREVIHVVSLYQDHALHEYQLKYHYLSDMSVLNRDYRPVYQLYAPNNSKIESVTVDGQSLDTKTFLQQKYGLFEYIQIPISLSLNIDHDVDIKFSSPLDQISDINQTAYSLTEMRQSGISDTGYGLVINLPENTHASIVTSPVDSKPQQVLYRFPTKTSTFGLGLGLNR